MNLPNSDVQVVFLVHVPLLDPITECLAVTGSHETLGNWNTIEAIEANYVGAATWKVAAYLPRNTTVYWKWVVLSRNTKEAVRSEEDPNRELGILDDDLIIESQWNGQEIIKALYCEGRRKILKLERRTLEEYAIMNASDEKDKYFKNKKGSVVNPWNRNNSYPSLPAMESEKCETRKSGSAAVLKVRSAENNDYSRKNHAYQDFIKLSPISIGAFSDQGSSVDDKEIMNWKKFASYSVPVGLITGAAALGIYIFRKLV